MGLPPHPLARSNPPDEVIGQSLSGAATDTHLRKWLDHRLSSSFPNANAMIEKMTLELHYKDMTFETLNQEDFLDSVKSAFPYIDWDKTYSDFLAAGEKKASHS